MIQHYIEHISEDGDTWDKLAYKYYGDARRYVPIMQANPHIPFNANIQAGVLVVIPLLEAQTDFGAPPWMN